jgi:hypothetical protein
MTPRQLAQIVTGCGVTITDVRRVGASVAFGTFTNGQLILGFDQGLIISSGYASSVKGPNDSTDTSGSLGQAGDDALTALAGQPTFDAAVLEFDFIPSGTTVTFDYVFGSEEYNEYVNTSFNDVFAFWLNGQNVAMVPGTTNPVSVNNVNDGNPIGTGTITNPAYYIDNAIGSATVADPVGSATRFAGCQLDGLTVVFTVTATVRPNVVNRMRFAIADAGDSIYDSAVFIRAGSLSSGPCGGSGTTASWGGGPAYEPMLAVPNPFRPGTGGPFGGSGVAIRPVPAGATVRLYTAAGVLVRTLADADGDGVVAWDARNDAGRDVASGVYLAVVEPRAGPRTRLKVVIIR